jgi:16S rRNA (cytidine1402-2'-O)-methyltransferase
MLYLVPTPIGNLEDMTLRGVRVLKEADLILAEDTRTSGRLLKHFGIDTPMRSHHAHNEHRVLQGLLEELQSGKTMALITDAGTPGISDPGFLLVRACHEVGIEVSALPGATALIPALVASGLPCDRFFFEGFLPHKKGRQTRLAHLADLPYTFVLFESPHRLVKCLQQLAEACGSDRPACVCREISKLHEEIVPGTLDELIQHFTAGGQAKGEIVIAVGGKPV